MVNWILNSVLSYPVAEEQLVILNFFGFRGHISLWILRLITFCLLGYTLYLWKNIIVKLVNSNIALISVLVLAISPMVFVLVLSYPLVCLKLFLFVLGLHFGLKNKWFYLILVLILLAFNWQVLGTKASIYYKLDLKDAQSEVTKRISSEDSLKESIDMPLWWRRIAYNKYYFSYKQILAESLSFFDFESIFFQEINPFSQKSVVIFYWPEMYLFILGLFYLYRVKDNKFNQFIGYVLLISWLDYIFTNGLVFKRFVLVIFPLSIIISLAFYNLFELVKKSNVLATLAFVFVSIFIFFGTINSFYDLSTRTQYWLDNRPLAFEFWFNEISKLDLDKYNKVQITSIVGDSKKYCYFYLGNICDDKKYIFESFDLPTIKSNNSIYAGFAGEYVGSKFKNDVDSNWSSTTLINIFAKKSLRDTIANKYGNDIGVGIVN